MMLVCDDDLPICHKINSHKQYLEDIIATSMLAQVGHVIGDKTKRNIITFNTGKISTTDFNLSKKDIELLDSIGYDTVVGFFKSKKTIWNFLGYY